MRRATFYKYTSIFISISIAFLTYLPSAVAQDEQEAGMLEEVIVTAQKREQGVQDIGIPISAFSSEKIDRLKIDDAQDIQFDIPNAVLTGNERWTIRGIGNNALSSTADNGTPVVFNGSFVGGSAQNEFYDMERIEVLRGPQGTLWGRNTTGGVVNMITKKPTDELGGDMYLEVGNYSTVKVRGAFNWPISDAIGQRFAFYYLNRDGYTENLSTGNDIDGRDQWSIRSTTTFDFSENTYGQLTLQYYEEDSSRSRENKRMCKATPSDSDFIYGCLPNELGFDSPSTEDGRVILQNLLAVFTGVFYPPGVGIYDNAPNPKDLRQVAADFDSIYVADEFVATFELAHDFNEHTLTWLTGYSESSSEGQTDYDNSDLPFRFLTPITYNMSRNQTVTTDRLLTTDSFGGNSETFSSELRLVSNRDSSFNYTAGLFYLDRENTDSGYYFWHPGLEMLAKTALGLPEEAWFFSGESASSGVKSWAAFGETYFDFSDNTKLTLGLRYTDEEKHIVTRTIFLSYPNPYTPVKADWQKWTGKIALDHFLDVDWSDQTLLYASLSSGYKGGGMNVGNDVDPTFDPEEVTAFEMGTKNQFFGNQLRANLTGFYYDYADLQLAQRIGTSAITENADATVWGIEAEFDWAPNENWLFDLNLAYLNTEIGDFITTDSTNPLQDPPTARPEQLLEDDPSTEDVEVNLMGNYLPHAPEFSVKFGAQYAWMMGGWDASARVDYFYQDDYFSREFNTVNDALESWDITNLIFRVQNGSGKWAFSAFVKNLQDNDNITNSIIETGLVGAYRNVRVLEPRTYGITAQYMF